MFSPEKRHFGKFRPECKQIIFGASLSHELIRESRAAQNLDFHSSIDSPGDLSGDRRTHFPSTDWKVEPFIANPLAPDLAEVETHTWM